MTLQPFLYSGDERAVWQRALAFAQAAHGTQTRKHTGEPYWHHVARVAVAVSIIPKRPLAAVVAALLHDVLEDTTTTAEEIEAAFGATVLAYVLTLTDPPKEFGNRAARKAETRRKLAAAPAWVKSIKLADLLDNAPSIIAHDPKFAKVFIAEKKDLLPALEGGDYLLMDTARAVVGAAINP